MITNAIQMCGGDLRQFAIHLNNTCATRVESKGGLWDTVSAILAKDANARMMCNNQDPTKVYNMLFENYAKVQLRDDALYDTAEIFSLMDTLRSGNINSLMPEAWELAYALPTKINISALGITYPQYKSKIKFRDY
jgi:hypothetical protein